MTLSGLPTSVIFTAVAAPFEDYASLTKADLSRDCKEL